MTHTHSIEGITAVNKFGREKQVFTLAEAEHFIGAFDEIQLEKGQQELVADLEALLAEAKRGEFSDFQNEKYPAPKRALVNRLDHIRENVISGKYDA